MEGATCKWSEVVAKIVCMSQPPSFLLYLMRVGA